MVKLDPIKIKWIVQEVKKGEMTQKQIAAYAGVTDRYVRMLYARYEETGSVPILQTPGRPRSADHSSATSIIMVTNSVSTAERSSTDGGSTAGLMRSGLQKTRPNSAKVLRASCILI